GLDRRAVRHRIGERHADLDEIGAGLGQLREQPREALAVGIAAGEIGHEPGAPGRCQRGETPADAAFGPRTHGFAHSSTPSALATVLTSLSPRPERLTTSRLSL